MRYTIYFIQHRHCLCIPSPDDCIREVVLIVSPKRQYRGILDPTTPATIFPEKLSRFKFLYCIEFSHKQEYYDYLFLDILKCTIVTLNKDYTIYICLRNNELSVTCMNSSLDCNRPRGNIRSDNTTTRSF